MKISRLLSEKQHDKVHTVLPSTSLQDTAQKLIEKRIGALIVCDRKGRMVGIVSERDLLPVVSNWEVIPKKAPVSKIMTGNVITCHPDDDIALVIKLMNSNSIRHIPVVKDEVPVNMVSIRELTTAYDLLKKEAETDPLTDLSTRRPFLRTLEAEYARAKRFKLTLVIAMVDIDHFKTVNDTYGHDAGDKVLREVSSLMISEFRHVENIGRLGGEEFAIIFPETEVEVAYLACLRLLERIENSVVVVDGAQIGVTASIGLAGVTPTTVSGAGILKRADDFLYVAKRRGRNRVVSDTRVTS